jgi:hypothetical protein
MKRAQPCDTLLSIPKLSVHAAAIAVVSAARSAIVDENFQRRSFASS